jgi:voltage-gated potassium channel
MAAPEAVPRLRVLLVVVRGLLVTTGIVVLYYVIPLRTTIDVGTLVRLLLGLAAFAVLIAWQLRAIVRSPHPALRAVETIAVAIPVFLLMFAATYALMSAAQPAAFSEPMSRTDALYFTVTVFATVGFGDLSPVSTAARVVVTIQMIADLLLLGLVLRAVLDAVDRGKARAEAPIH